MKFLFLPELGVNISLQPVSHEDYWQVERNGNSILARNNHRGAVTRVSATEAREYASRLGGRLPTREEMVALAIHVKRLPSAFACASGGCLSEWLNCSPDWTMGGQASVCILNPSWLKSGNKTRIRGSIPDRRMSFVTFRLVMQTS